MELFYWAVLAFAIVVLILTLTAMAIYMKYSIPFEIYPMVNSDKWNPCPDGWVHKEGKCYAKSANQAIDKPFDSKNYSLDLKPVDQKSPSGYMISGNFLNKDGSIVTNSSSSEGEVWVSFGDVAICDKKQWAKVHQIKWDGISNYSEC